MQLDSSGGELLRMVFVAISPWDVSPHRIRGTCKGWQSVYDTDNTWEMLLERHLVPSGEALVNITTALARRQCNLRLQAPFQHLILGEDLRAFRESGYRALDLSQRCSALPEQGRQFYIYTYS